MQLTEHHIRKRTAGEAAIRFGKFVFASGKQAFMWNRGRKAMKFVLKDAKLASTDMGVNEYTKVGGITRAMRDFMAARLHGVGSQVDPSDGTECYDGFAGEVWFLLKISDSKATLFVNKAANEVR